MKKTVPDISWLPSGEEWDFRTVTPVECRVACHWEYSRDFRRIMEVATKGPEEIGGAKENDGGNAWRDASRLYCPASYRQAARELFPQAWTSLTQEQRGRVVGSFYPVPALQVRRLGDFFRRMQWAEGAHLELLQPYLDYAYVIQPSFSLHGVEAVIKEFKVWARKEAKNYWQSPRAKAAQLPFDALKWLAVWRLEEARRKAGITFERAQEALLEYRRKHSLTDRNDVFPIYASHGAWSKARGDAERCRSKAMKESSFLLAGLS